MTIGGDGNGVDGDAYDNVDDENCHHQDRSWHLGLRIDYS